MNRGIIVPNRSVITVMAASFWPRPSPQANRKGAPPQRHVSTRPTMRRASAPTGALAAHVFALLCACSCDLAPAANPATTPTLMQRRRWCGGRPCALQTTSHARTAAVTRAVTASTLSKRARAHAPPLVWDLSVAGGMHEAGAPADIRKGVRHRLHYCDWPYPMEYHRKFDEGQLTTGNGRSRSELEWLCAQSSDRQPCHTRKRAACRVPRAACRVCACVHACMRKPCLRRPSHVHRGCGAGAGGRDSSCTVHGCAQSWCLCQTAWLALQPTSHRVASTSGTMERRSAAQHHAHVLPRVIPRASSSGRLGTC